MSRYPDSPNPNSIEEGLEFQDFVTDVLAERGIIIQNYTSKKWQLEKGENRQGWEIKLDSRCTETKRLSIEIAEKTRVDGPWIPSGIYRAGPGYVQGNFDCLWVFWTHFLRALHRCGKYEEKEEPTLKSFYISITDADKYGWRVEPKGERETF